MIHRHTLLSNTQCLPANLLIPRSEGSAFNTPPPPWRDKRRGAKRQNNKFCSPPIPFDLSFMLRSISIGTLTMAFMASSVTAQQGMYAQCGGIGWSGKVVRYNN